MSKLDEIEARLRSVTPTGWIPSDLVTLLRVARASEKLDRASEVVHDTPMMTTAYNEAVDAANVAYEEWRAALTALESEPPQ